MSNELKNILYKGYKFGIVGILSTTFNYGIFVVLYKIISIHYIVSSVTGYVSGLLLGYLLNKNWTFSAQVDKSKNYIVKLYQCLWSFTGFKSSFSFVSC